VSIFFRLFISVPMASALRRCKSCLHYKESKAEFTRERWVCNACPPSSEDDFLTYTYQAGSPGKAPVAIPVAHSATAAAVLYGRTQGIETPTYTGAPAQGITTYVREDGTTVVNRPGTYKEAWDHRIKEPTWTGAVREPLRTDASPKFSSASPTALSAGSPKRECILLEAQPTKAYDNLAGVRVMRAIPPGTVMVDRKTIEFPLLPSIHETRTVKADPLDIHPIGTRQHPAKVMPERNGFQVSRAVVTHVDGISTSTVSPHVVAH
jgi:hypothetical protein